MNTDKKKTIQYYPVCLEKIEKKKSIQEDKMPVVKKAKMTITIKKYQSKAVEPENFYKLITTIL